LRGKYMVSKLYVAAGEMGNYRKKPINAGICGLSDYGYKHENPFSGSASSKNGSKWTVLVQFVDVSHRNILQI
jgi:hypothetical protein